MNVSPWWLLAVVIAVLIVVRVADRQVSRRRAGRLRRLAEHEGFRYSLADRFGLGRRVRDVLPGVAGAVCVRDLMYRSDGDTYAYVFTAVVEGEAGGQFVVAGRERRGDARLSDVRRDDATLSLGEQYRRLLHDAEGAPVVPADAAVSDVRPVEASGR